jgi:predicted dehydrogenase
MKTVKYGIIGTGMIATFFAEDSKFVSNHEIVAVCSRTMSKAKSFKEKFDLKYAYDDLDEMLSNKEIDAIYIATPHSRHMDDAIKSMRAKKAVLCEKPITVNGDELKKLVQVWEEEKVLLMEAIWTRFLPSTIKLLELIDEKVIGDIIFMQSDFGFNVGPNYDPKRRLLNKELAGGARLDVGIYPIFFTDLVFNQDPININCIISQTETDVDGYSMCQFEYPDKKMAQLAYGVRADMRQDAFIVGTKGSIKVPKFWMGSRIEVEMIPDDYDGENRILKTYEFDRTTHGYDYEIEAFNESFRNNELENKYLPISKSIQIMKLLDQCSSE